jgi:hypothetical protein
MKRTKRCPGCKRHLPRDIAHFGRNRGHRDGVNTYCRRCGVEIPRKRAIESRSSARAIADAEIMTQAEFWETWRRLLETFLADDERYLQHHFSGDGARMETQA